MIRAIGTAARTEIERELGGRVHLDLTVKVRKGWRRDEGLLDRLGIEADKARHPRRKIARVQHYFVDTLSRFSYKSKAGFAHTRRHTDGSCTRHQRLYARRLSLRHGLLLAGVRSRSATCWSVTTAARRFGRSSTSPTFPNPILGPGAGFLQA